MTMLLAFESLEHGFDEARATWRAGHAYRTDGPAWSHDVRLARPPSATLALARATARREMIASTLRRCARLAHRTVLAGIDSAIVVVMMLGVSTVAWRFIGSAVGDVHEPHVDTTVVASAPARAG